MLDDDTVARLRGALLEAGYTVDGVRARLGPVAVAALDREQPVPARQALVDDDSPLATFTRLFLLGDQVGERELLRALAPGFGVGRAGRADLAPPAGGRLAPILTGSGDDQVAAAIELAPYQADEHAWWVAADWSPWRTGRPLRPDHVLGVGGATAMLAQSTVRRPVGRALDLGTGSGTQALHLSGHTTLPPGDVVATDVSDRCLSMAALTAGLAGVSLDLRRGSLFEPVAGERFDVIVSNPPFVVSPPGLRRYLYRDAGLPGDGVCQRLVGEAERHLADGGWCQLLANWEIRSGQDWTEAVAAWLEPTGLDGWVVQREVQDPAEYVETWLRDSGDDRGDPDAYASRYASWLDDLRARDVSGIGFGLVTLRRGGREQPVRRFQHAPQRVSQPLGPHVEAWFEAQDLLAAHPGAQVLMLPLSPAADVRVDTRVVPGQAQPVERVVLRETGFRWSASIDEVGQRVLAGADSRRPIGEVVAQVAAGAGLDAGEALAASVPVLRRMVEEGFLLVDS